MEQKHVIKLMSAALAAARQQLAGKGSLQDVKEAQSAIYLAWLESERPPEEISKETVLAEARKQSAFTVARREGERVTPGGKEDQFGPGSAGFEPEERYYPEGQLAVLHDTDVSELEYVKSLERRRGTPAEMKRWKVQAELFRLHYGEKVFPGQPRLLTKRVVAFGEKGVDYEAGTKIPCARRDLVEFHELARRGDSCPTCKRIARFIHGVGQEEVAEVIDRLLLEISSKRTR